MNKVYIASPFFNDEQLDLVKKIEHELEIVSLAFYSPRLDGVLQNMTVEQRKLSKKRIFENNVKHIHECDVMVAVIDGRDIGTIWEMGCAYAMHKQIITVTSQNYGVNIMLAESIYAHIHSLYDVVPAVQSARLGGPWLIADNRDVY